MGVKMKKVGTIPIRLNIGIPITLNVELYSIKSSSNSVYLKPLTKCCMKPRQAKYFCSGCDKEVGRDYTRGYKTGKDSYIELTDKELETLSDLNKGFDLIGFIKQDILDLNALSTAYPIEAQDNKELYSLIFNALKETNTAMFGKFVMKETSNLNNQQFAVVRVSDVNNSLVIQKIELTDSIKLEQKELTETMKGQLKSIKDFVKSNTIKNFDIKNYTLTKIQEIERLIDNKLAGKKIEVIEIAEKPQEQKIDFSTLATAKVKV